MASDSQKTSYGRILRSSSSVGGASIARILIGILRIKTLAILIGAAGIGVLGLLTSVMTMGTTLASCGLQNSGVREISNAKNDEQLAWTIRRAIWALGTILGVGGMLATWFFRAPISASILGPDADSSGIGWIAVGLFVSVVGLVPLALLQGQRQIQAIAKVQVLGGLLGAVVSVAVVVLWGESVIAVCVVAMPAAMMVVALLFLRVVPSPQTLPVFELREVWQHMRKILSFGVLLMVGGLVTTGVDLAIRSLVTEELGLAAAGQFHAALQLSTLYLSLVLGAMSTDYYPRLVEVLSANDDPSQVIAEQTEIGILLAGPVIIAALALAPWIVELLYTSDFAPAVEVFRWQVLADAIKIITWPIGFLFIARREGLVFLGIQVVTFGLYLVLNILAIPVFGLPATGMAFFGMYLLHLPLMSFLGRRAVGFRWTSQIMRDSLRLLAAAAGLLGLSYWSQLGAALAGSALSLVFAALSLRRLDEMSTGGRLGKALTKLRKSMRL